LEADIFRLGLAHTKYGEDVSYIQRTDCSYDMTYENIANIQFSKILRRKMKKGWEVSL